MSLLPPMRSRSVFQLLPYGGFESMKSNSRAGEAVLRERRAVEEVLRLVAFALQQQVGLGDGVGLGVHLLPVEVDGDLFAVLGRQLLQPLLGDGEHAARAAGAVVEQVGARLDLVGDGTEDEVGHQLHDVARREVLAGLLVVLLVEAADQLLEDRAHAVVVERRAAAPSVDRAEVDRRVEELLDQAAEDVGIDERRDLVAELELVEDLLHVRREAVEVGLEVRRSCCALADRLQVAQRERRRVVERLPGGLPQGGVLVGDAGVVERLLHLEHGLASSAPAPRRGAG